jgi:putative heme-binding domain-containing protein
MVTLKDGRVLSGNIAARSERTITVRTMTEEITVERDQVAGIVASPVSLMPEGLLHVLTDEQVRDLMGYLMSDRQAPLPEEK